MRASYVRETLKQELADTPDTSIYYSKSGYIIAGALLEKMAGKSSNFMISSGIRRFHMHDTLR
jgi:CubicO group peptidase (beta-lactamase class C family)